MRALLVLLVALTGPALAQPGKPEFQVRLAATVFSTAFGFIASRSLEPTSADQIALWGLRSVTALDAALAVEARDGTLHLKQAGRGIYERGIPPAPTGELWGPAAADVLSAAWDASDLVRQVGTQGVITSLFEEVFNHLDPYSRYLPPGVAEADRDRRSGEAGAGLQVVTVGGAFVIQSVNAAGPGADSGVLPGDRILAVDDQPTAGEDLATVLGWIGGLEGTDVSLTLRGRDGRIRTLEVERAVVPPETVFAQRSGAILVLRVTGFSADTDQRLRQELERSLPGPARDRVRGVVLDLRGNRGGLLRQAVATTGLVLGSGIIATTAGRNANATHEFRATTDDLTDGRPLVVLVDGRSASAAEIMAAALADDGRAIVVGSSTLGKGLVQTIATLPDGGELFVTWSRVLAPLGWPIQGLGVLPQVCTSLGAEALSQQMQSLARGVSRMAPALARHRAARAPLLASDIIDRRTVCPAADGRDADLATARFLLGNPKAYDAALIPP